MQSLSQLLDLALQHHQAGQLRQAEVLYRQILQMDPRHADALHFMGVIAQQTGRSDLSIEYIQQALRLRPDFPMAYYNLGLALRTQGNLDKAITCYQQALQLKPDFAEASNNLGVALKEQGRLEEAITHYRQALRLRPDHAEAHNNLGNVLKEQAQFEEAILCYRQALRLKPDYAEAYSNLGAALKYQGKHDEAIVNLRQALYLKPDFALAHFNLSTQLLLLGNFDEGWQEFEWRWQTGRIKQGLRHFSQPLWQGNPLPHGTILLHAEQGLGDTIQFIRFAALVKERVGTVLCESQPNLVRLLGTCAGIDRVIPAGDPLPAFDVHAPLMSLPGILKITLETIPARIPYLQADAALNEAQARALVGATDFKIGIVWQGNPRTWDVDLQRFDGRRSIPLVQFELLAHLPGVRLVSLQKGFGTEQIQELAGRFPIVELESGCNEFSDGGTAAVMKNLDLVISADSSPAHLAGALGVPVWVPLASAACWRWLLDREDSPWYPTMRLFRQTVAGDWSDVFERMARALADLIPKH